MIKFNKNYTIYSFPFNFQVKDKFAQLVAAQLLIRCPPILEPPKAGDEDDGLLPVFATKGVDLFLMPDVVLDGGGSSSFQSGHFLSTI